MFDNDEPYYDGSRAFEWLAKMFGFQVDLMNFLICQILALLLASLFRSILHPSKVSSGVRHAFGLTLGLFFGYFCFGQQAIHIAGLPAICYIVIRTQSPQIVQRSVMVVAMFYLLCIHLHRQIYDYGSYSLDITGPLMIITQKVTSLAFSIHDGFTREQDDLTTAQQYHAVKRLPSALEYFSYVLHFQGLMAGPVVFYKDYINFIEGYNLLKNPGSNGNLDNNNAKEIILEPSPKKAVIKKVIGSIICAFIFMKYATVYPISSLKDDDFVNNTTIFYKFWFAMMATTIVRFKYYHAWLWADAVCNNAGLGFNGYDKDGSSQWDLLSNINVLSFELATNMRDGINSWNIGTNRWLRFVVYERVPKKYGTVLTFALSAIWHGFYPGYYITFATGALFVEAARSARKMFRYRFQRTRFTRISYDIITCLITRLSMGYITFPFVLLEFWASLQMYLKFYTCLHIVAFFTVFILPKFIKGHDNNKKSSIRLINSDNIKNSTENINDENFHNNDKNWKAQKSSSVSSNSSITYNYNNDTNNYERKLLKPIAASEAIKIKHDENEIDNISNKIKEKIDIETKNIEELIDKTVTGIVEFKDDLMRINDNENNLYSSTLTSTSPLSSDVINCDGSIDNLHKRNINTNVNENNLTAKNVDKFLKKEIDAINACVQQANVLPAVLSNGHAK